MSSPSTALGAAPTQTLTTGLQVPTAAQSGGAFPPFDPSTFVPQLVWLAITFGALYWIMSRVALPRIGSVLEERRDRIERDLAEAERMKAETDAALKAYEQAIGDARGKAQALARETREALAAETERERVSADEKMAVKLAETEKQIAATKVRALASVNEIAVDTAAAIVNRLIGKDVPAAEIAAALAQRERT
jgi:F-type H+-transporting ATPase subunit b